MIDYTAAAPSAKGLPKPAPKAQPGQKIAVVSPSFAAPGYGPEVHEQAMHRLVELTGMEVKEYPTTRVIGSSPQDRARDLNDAFADPEIGAVMATIGGSDQITVIPHVDQSLIAAKPKPFIGYSDNTHLHNLLWNLGVCSFYGGSTQVHIGAGPAIDDVHAASLLSAMRDGGELELTNPPLSEDYGFDWKEERSLTETGVRRPTEPWTWSGPTKTVEAQTWGGCVQVIQEIIWAGRFTNFDLLDGKILILEGSEDIIEPIAYADFMRALGERGLLSRIAGLVVSRFPATSFTFNPSEEDQAAYRRSIRDISHGVMEKYGPQAVVCVGPPFGHTRPQWIVPYGGKMRMDRASEKLFASYD